MQIFEAHRTSSILSFTVASDAQVNAVQSAKSTGMCFSPMGREILEQRSIKQHYLKKAPVLSAMAKLYI
jgi:hypothetical protein